MSYGNLKKGDLVRVNVGIPGHLELVAMKRFHDKFHMKCGIVIRKAKKMKGIDSDRENFYLVLVEGEELLMLDKFLHPVY
tara:strand:- start:870 stop:1109 length:240 start_codon:yes stop_codon:yes gene_type:complete